MNAARYGAAMGRKEREQASWIEDTQTEPLDVCVLCGREGEMTDHHLVPKSQGRRQGVKLGEIPTVKMCAACQGFLVKTFSNAQLANELSTVEAIQAREEVQKFVKWVQKQPLSRGVRVH
ncbi:HNH endonuclease [Deinococcus arenae]|uniref:HNH endonuclease n=2 Tax=Deinococcus arenae TaxID=1452751 RepID=A0A8H9GPM3_9DEIO|nr:HNH endonuclease [Deinococcus arenae]